MAVNIRKQLGDITIADLLNYSAWENALDEVCIEGQDEDTFRPVTDELIDASCIVLANFVLNDGTLLHGYVFADTSEESQADCLHPTIITTEGQVPLWYGLASHSDERIAASYRRLNKQPDQVFPIKFEAVHSYLNRPIVGTIQGFSGLGQKPNEFWHRK